MQQAGRASYNPGITEMNRTAKSHNGHENRHVNKHVYDAENFSRVSWVTFLH